ncbi:MAG: site-specific DNA-methyltransferase [Elusimicrobia bacterium]|nr:site-specific DNA-methyltransferase [Elusimicrobiota bacterium]
MNEENRQVIADKIRRGDELPFELAKELFPKLNFSEKKECEIIYEGKEREEDVIANTLAVPLQEVRTFGKNGVNWHNMLVFGENLQVLKRLLELKKAGKLKSADGTPGVKLVYIDPPFATKQEFRGSQDQKAYQDKIAGAEFVEFLRKRLIIIKELLSENGTLYLHLDSKKVHAIKIVLDELLPNYEFSEIIWLCGLMGSGKFFPKAHETILCYKSKTAYFKAPPRLGYSERITNALTKDSRGWYYTRGQESSGGMGNLKTYVCRDPKLSKEDAIKVANKERPQAAWSVWIGKEELAKHFNDSAVGTYAHSPADDTGYPTQKPEGIMERVLMASSKEGDLVMDCFAGSGTFLAVAEKMNRNWVGIDCGKLAIYTIQKRMLSLKNEIGNRGNNVSAKPYTLYNAGLYDFSKLKELSREDWRFFALQLFECKDDPHTIGGIALDGKRRGQSVLVFDHHSNPNKQIDEETIKQLHASLGNKIGSKFFIIAQKGAFAFQQDYIDFGGVRYYALRIPYSFINELHRREFTALKQPSDFNAVNETVNAVGFDFIQPPVIEWKLSVSKRKDQLLDEVCLKIKSFESKARLRGEDTKGGLETFSMLMVDFDYNGKVFDMDYIQYAQQLKENDWQAWMPIEDIGERVMVTFIDIYGNESAQVLTRKEIGLPVIATHTKIHRVKTKKRG